MDKLDQELLELKSKVTEKQAEVGVDFLCFRVQNFADMCLSFRSVARQVEARRGREQVVGATRTPGFS